MCGGAASRELSVALPCLAQPSPSHLESPSIGGVVVCIVLFFAIEWDGPAWTWDGGERGTRTRTGQRWQSRYGTLGTCIPQRQKVRVPCFSYKQTM